MPKKIHPADIANANVLAQAVRFDIALFLGSGRYATASARTIELARMEAARLVIEHPNCGGRRPLIYGVTAEGRSGLVPNAYNPTKTETLTMPKNAKKTATKKPAAKSAAQATADNLEFLKRDAVATAKATQKKTAKAKASGKANGAKRKLGARAQIEADAMAGKMPTTPDFSAATHARFRPKLAELVALAKARDVAGLKKFPINPISSSPKAMARYRDLCVMALSAK
jgi:hypothetical protein